MREGTYTDRRWKEDESDALKGAYENTGHERSKRAFWMSLAKAHSSPIRDWRSVSLKASKMGLEPKVMTAEPCVIQRLYSTLGDTLSEVAERYGTTVPHLIHCRSRGKIAAPLMYRMLDDAMELDENWEEYDARELQGILVDD